MSKDHFYPIQKVNGFHTALMPIHQQNERDKGQHIEIIENGLTLLAWSSVPLKLWWLAFQELDVLIYTIHSCVLGFLSPFLLLLKKKLNYLFFKIFGCTNLHYLVPQDKNKFSFHTQKCVFVSYSLRHKGHKCLTLNFLHDSSLNYLAFNSLVINSQ